MTNDPFDALQEARRVDPGDDQLADEHGIEQETPTAGGSDVEYGVVDDDRDDQEETDDGPVAVCRFCEREFPHEIAERRHHCMGRDATHMTSVEGRKLIDPAVHEFEAKLLFTPDDDVLRGSQSPTAPFFAIAGNWHKFLATDDGEDDIGLVDAAGDTWYLNHEKVNKWDSAIATRPGDAGDVYNEYQLHLVADDDVGEKKVNIQFRIAAPGLCHHETGDPIQSLPDDLPEGIRVQIDSSNVEPDETLKVLRAVMAQAGIEHRYFREDYIHEWSRVVNFALYVRIARALSEEKIVSRNGLLERLARFSSVRRGRGEYKWDNEEIIGHRNAVAMNPTSLGKFYDDHRVGKLLKSYHMKDPKKQASDDPTTEPKLEVQFSTDYSPNDLSTVPWSDPDGFDFADLQHEVDEYLMFALNSAGLPLRADPDTYVADEYWSLQETARDLEIHSDRTDDLRQAEEEMATYQLASDDATPAQRAVLRALADGGRAMDRDELAEDSDTSTSTVQRAFETFGSLIERVEQGTYALADEVIADKVDELMSGLEDVAEWVEDGIDALVESKHEIANDSALANWARNHRARVQGTYDGLEIDLAGTRNIVEIRRVLRAGLEAARRTGSKTAAEFVDADITFTVDGDRRTQKAFSRIGSGLKILGAEDVDLV